MGVGKESDIYDAEHEGGRIVIVKFHREGTTFRHVKRSRGYFGEAERCSWMLASRLAAEREYEAIATLYGNVAVPTPIAHNRHVIVIGLVNGREMSNTALGHPVAILEKIIAQIKLTYELGIIHADLSEYNVIVCADGNIALIDWPQWVPASHSNADDLLYRDVSTVLSYFARKYQIARRTEEVGICKTTRSRPRTTFFRLAEAYLGARWRCDAISTTNENGGSLVASKRTYTIVGVDPGTTAAFAVLDLKGRLLRTGSSRSWGFSSSWGC